MHTKSLAAAMHTSTRSKAVRLPQAGCRGWVASTEPHVGVVPDFACDLKP